MKLGDISIYLEFYYTLRKGYESILFKNIFKKKIWQKMLCKKCVKSIDIYLKTIKIKKHEKEVAIIIFNNY